MTTNAQSTWRCDPCALDVKRGSDCPSCNAVDPQANTVVHDDVSGQKDTQVIVETDALPAGHMVGGGYTIVRPIGRGGMGVVYQARQQSLDRIVALKALDVALSQNTRFVERFDKEIRALVELNHPNITQIIDRGREGQFYFFVMEYVEGVNLRQLLAKGALDPEHALQLVEQLCRALDFAHSRNILHRDVKPENLMISSSGDLKVLDFGLARLKDREHPGKTRLTKDNTLLGTVDYMAPEQRQRGEVDHRADIYSLGVVFYEMLTGNVPVGRFQMPSDSRQDLGPRFDQVVIKALEANPSERFQHASDFSAAVQELRSSIWESGVQSSYRESLLPPVQSIIGLILSVMSVLMTGLLLTLTSTGRKLIGSDATVRQVMDMFGLLPDTKTDLAYLILVPGIPVLAVAFSWWGWYQYRERASAHDWLSASLGLVFLGGLVRMFL